MTLCIKNFSGKKTTSFFKIEKTENQLSLQPKLKKSFQIFIELKKLSYSRF